MVTCINHVDTFFAWVSWGRSIVGGGRVIGWSTWAEMFGAYILHEIKIISVDDFLQNFKHMLKNRGGQALVPKSVYVVYECHHVKFC